MRHALELAGFIAFLATGCASAQRPARISSSPGTRQQGYASFYSDALAGNTTANGETYDPATLSAAHRTLPFGTRVRVDRSDRRASVVVRINDRGPFAGRQRIIDLSRAAAEALSMVRAGVVPVSIEVLPRENRRK